MRLLSLGRRGHGLIRHRSRRTERATSPVPMLTGLRKHGLMSARLPVSAGPPRRACAGPARVPGDCRPPARVHARAACERLVRCPRCCRDFDGARAIPRHPATSSFIRDDEISGLLVHPSAPLTAAGYGNLTQMSGGERPGRWRWLAAAVRRVGALALVLLLLPWVWALALVLSHHHLDSGAVGILATVSLGLPALVLGWAAYKEATRTSADSGPGGRPACHRGRCSVGSRGHCAPP